ncbi:MAG: hypothetical protein ACOYJQ_08875 [Pseudochelatococcus sp.]|uniref:hypothetical protein n=1 Tax=Pseudochelatococcus sp. TaxID=2020869 RepID=UPI003D94B762
MSKAPRPWARVLLIALLFLPTPIVAARPALMEFLSGDWLGVPAAIVVIPAYLLLFILLAQSNSAFSARMEA